MSVLNRNVLFLNCAFVYCQNENGDCDVSDLCLVFLVEENGEFLFIYIPRCYFWNMVRLCKLYLGNGLTMNLLKVGMTISF